MEIIGISVLLKASFQPVMQNKHHVPFFKHHLSPIKVSDAYPTRLILITNYSNLPRMEVRGNRNHGFKFTLFGMQMRLRVVIKKHFD